jgi:hypothetical protein
MTALEKARELLKQKHHRQHPIILGEGESHQITGDIRKESALTNLGFKKKKLRNLGADGSDPMMANAKTNHMDEPHPDYNEEFINAITNAADGSLNKVTGSA